jgi:hypothetical protein
MMLNSRFAGTCTRCRAPYNIGDRIEWIKGIKGATHAHCVNPAPGVWKPTPTAPVANLKGLADFLHAAKDRGLQSPKLRVLAPDAKSELRISLTKGGLVPGSLAVVLSEEFIGCVRPNGEVTGRLKFDATLLEHLANVAVAPATAAKIFAALTCRCSFCNLTLTDAGSIEVGYGPVCADHWGLPHHPHGTPVLSPVGAV